jgi:transposase
LEKRPPGRVVLETCAEAFSVADEAVEAGHDVRVVPATLVRSLGVGARRLKTDRRDAQILSEVSARIDLVSVHIPSLVSRQLKTICGMRESLVSARTKIVNCVRGWLRTQRLSLRGRGVRALPARVRELCIDRFSEVPVHVERMAVAIEQLSALILDANKQVAGLAKQDQRTVNMMTVPGVGPVTSLRYAAALDEVGRFATAHAAESYLGMVPGERSSSDRTVRTGITKAGSTAVRWTLIQAAWSAWRTRPNDPMVRWAQQVALRRGVKVAITALARKLAGILYAIWRDGTRYDPTRGARKLEIATTPFPLEGGAPT